MLKCHYGISGLSIPSGTKRFGGTEDFMASEIIKYNCEEEYTEKVVCFSFEMFIYELIAMHQPFEIHESVKESILEGHQPALTYRDYSVQWRKLWTIIKEMGVPENLIDLIRNLYTKSRAATRVEVTLLETFQPTKSVRQGCILSAIFFNIYSEAVLREALQEWKGGVVIGGKMINNLCFAMCQILNRDEPTTKTHRRIKQQVWIDN
ncbi:Protein kinase domain,Reverse transcriptase domain [Cinara cedri]|uniref:Protein kinase domain,Reverse transcriptase domain n=1 Tax=Cinara cedri TaxID=506608 RepID=A0A5E4NI35_9HEMI|nr:Protein kinase domain,Reverse transcriptase domain [Cinara cedri]